MKRFRVRWVARSGEIRSRKQGAESAEALEREYASRGERVLDVHPIRFRSVRFWTRFRDWIGQIFARGLNSREVHQLFYELGVILTAGVPILAAVGMLRREPHRAVVRNFLLEIESGLKEGGSLSELLSRQGAAYDFTRIVPILRMGEKTGRLGESCRTVARNLDQWLRIQGEISSALIYPTILAVTGVVAVYLLMVYVIPRFREVITGFRVTLPWYANWLFSSSDLLSRYHDLIVLVLILVLAGVLVLLQRPGFRQWSRSMVFRLPLIRNIRFSTENVRFVSALSHLLEGGIPVLPAIELAAGNFTDPLVRRHLHQVSAELKRGRRIGEALEETGIFPPVMTNMIRVGEDSGTLAMVSAELRELLSRRFLQRTRRIMNLLEPLIILLVAGFVAMLVLSILPIIMNLGEFNG